MIMESKLETVKKELKLEEKDTGSSFVQITKLYESIKSLSETHFSVHKKDKHSRKGLQDKIAKMRKLIKYIRASEPQKYEQFRQIIGLRK